MVRCPIRILVLAVLAVFGATLLVAPPASAVGTRPLKVVLVGDSYSAGNAGEDYYGPAECFRSRNNWAELYVKKLYGKGYAPTLVNRACSGGVTADFAGKRKVSFTGLGYCRPESADETITRSLPIPRTAAVQCSAELAPQVDAIDKSTDLVLFTFGGNDIGFDDIVKQCFVVGFRDPDGCQSQVDTARSRLPKLSQDLEQALVTMRGKLRSDAKVVMLGYPQLVPSGYQMKNAFTGKTYDLDQLRTLGEAGKTAQMRAVSAAEARVGADFITYEDRVIEKFSGHEPGLRPGSSNSARWIREAGDGWPTKEWYHPNADGHEAYAQLLDSRSVGAGRPPATGSSLDLAIVIDTTGSMGSTIDAVKSEVTELIDRLSRGTTSYRVALVSYRDFPERTRDTNDYPARLERDFTTDAVALKSSVAALSADGGGDYPESAFSGIETALDLGWRAGVKKSVIVFTDAPALSPEPVSGLTAQQIVDHARAIDPVVVNVVDSGGARDLSGVVSGTGGVNVSASAAEVPEALDAILDVSLSAPYAWMREQYVGAVGTSTTFDASGSYDPAGGALTYAWDVDDDGRTDATTTDPFYSHTYTSPYEGLAAVTVTTTSGLSSEATASVIIDADGDGVPSEIDQCPRIADRFQNDQDGDGTGDACDPTPGYPATDRPGVTVTKKTAPPPTSAPADLKASLVGSATLVKGQQATYTLTVTNTSGVASTATTATIGVRGLDSLLAGPGSTGTGTTKAGGSSATGPTWALVPLAPGASATFTVSGTIAGTTTPGYGLTVNVVGVAGASTGEASLLDNTAVKIGKVG